MTDKKKTTKPVQSNDEFVQALTAVNELTEALQRERADSMNMRRQHEAALASARHLATVRVVRELLPAIDSLERSLKHVPTDLQDHDYVKGVQAVLKQFDKVFADLGIERIKTVGEEFDPMYHEAVHMDDSAGGQKEIVSAELQAGYKMGDEVIRHAMVNVATR